MDKTPVRFFTLKSVSRMLRSAGYRIVREESTVIPIELTFGLSPHNPVMKALNQILAVLTKLMPTCSGISTSLLSCPKHPPPLNCLCALCKCNHATRVQAPGQTTTAPGNCNVELGVKLFILGVTAHKASLYPRTTARHHDQCNRNTRQVIVRVTHTVVSSVKQPNA